MLRENMICAIEASFRTPPEEEIRSTTQYILKSAKPATTNLSRETRRVITESNSAKKDPTTALEKKVQNTISHGSRRRWACCLRGKTNTGPSDLSKMDQYELLPKRKFPPSSSIRTITFVHSAETVSYEECLVEIVTSQERAMTKLLQT
ncbi:hypothetical protein Trydic_g6555 [Trypoxylus dichotomus]